MFSIKPTMRLLVIILVVLFLQVDASKMARRRRRREAAQREDALRKVYCSATAVALGILPNSCPNEPVWGSHVDSKHLEHYKTHCNPLCNPALNVHENKGKMPSFVFLASFGMALFSAIIFNMFG
jgi:hypothetical protein